MTTSLLLWLLFFSIVKNRIKTELLEKWQFLTHYTKTRSGVNCRHVTHRSKRGANRQPKWVGGAGGFRRLWVHRVDGYTMLMSPLRVALGRDSCPWLPGWYGYAHAYCPGCGLVYGCQLPLRFAIFVLLNSHLECFLSASKIAIFFSVCYATNRLPHARVIKQKSVKLNLIALVFTPVKLAISYLIHIENHCAHIYNQSASRCIFGQARSACYGINAGIAPSCFEADG